ncbi:VOC family protein [Novosphingobium mathurense]|uniref:Catechol-2,3-dioxygenase n=1 Tax=Novosphingobium mathurense TaxID=428990 RepID=A0A1U6ILP7_9SPHN|nr:VOC family protein [Novosphingobium mathurense]SLK08949.1 Catechol-2,3-dioxygenase [Novosphingobium mathurense]
MRLKGLHHVRFQVRDLDLQERFCADFGLVTAERTDERLVMRTRGGDECAYVAVKGDSDKFLGMAFEVEDTAYLEEAVTRLGASAPTDLALPGGGKAVTFADPFGNEVTLIHGASRRAPEEFYPELVHNTPFEKNRFGRNQTSREVGPAKLWRIGHMALFVKSFAEAHAWYTENLGMIGSDIYHIPGQPQVKIVGFLRLDRGDEYVDHHVLALMQDERGGCHHISFETQDFEAQQRTHRYLGKQAYEPIWGVGRHPHGSHVFDVWRAPDGARFETFSDTDLFRIEDGTKVHDISTIDMDVWSEDEPTRYFV